MDSDGANEVDRVPAMRPDVAVGRAQSHNIRDVILTLMSTLSFMRS